MCTLVRAQSLPNRDARDQSAKRFCQVRFCSRDLAFDFLEIVETENLENENDQKSRAIEARCRHSLPLAPSRVFIWAEIKKVR
jgi:hypothetical protein